MRQTITKTLSEARSKLNAYTSLLNLRYANLCIEADAQALLPVTVKIDDNEQNIEDVALISNPQKDQFAIYPKDQLDIPDITKAIMQAHPEFKMEVKDWDDYPEQFKEEGEEFKYLLFTMPEVNKDRRDLLVNGVKVLHGQWEAKFQEVKTSSAARITACMAGEDEEVVKGVMEQLDNSCEICHKMGEGATDEKLKEIEEAYKKYLERQKELGVSQQANNEQSGLSMRMGQSDDE